MNYCTHSNVIYHKHHRRKGRTPVFSTTLTRSILGHENDCAPTRRPSKEEARHIMSSPPRSRNAIIKLIAGSDMNAKIAKYVRSFNIVYIYLAILSLFVAICTEIITSTTNAQHMIHPQQANSSLLPGLNMENFRINELEPVGSNVYSLKVTDKTKENRKITFEMTDDTFSLDDEDIGEVPSAASKIIPQTRATANDRALLPLDSNRLMLPQMQQIKARFNQGCVGGTKCQFFAFCWMSGGSLGASCGLLMTCCVTPSRQEIQPGFYGPVVNDPYCGRSTSKISRIVGGTDASFGQFPWQAFVQVGGSRCGGALISSRHVVTAGHCVARSQHSPSSIKVTLGDYILNSDIESIPHEVYSVVEVLLHPNFRFTPQADRYDVAVLELDRTTTYKDNIKPICLPQKDATFVGRVAYVAGWGALQAGSKLRPKVLQHVAVPVIENHVCESWHRRKGIDIRIYDEMMCAGYELGQRDACQGDSGGPLMLNQFGVWYLVGIVSAGYSCAKQYQPGIYHRVSSSSDWISSNVYQQGNSK